VFLEDADRSLFVSTLGEACAKTDWQVHAYCLMKNHFHLVVETLSANLAAGMQWDRGNPSTGGSRNTETQNVDMLGTDPFTNAADFQAQAVAGFGIRTAFTNGTFQMNVKLPTNTVEIIITNNF
jgi:hypothetical protein